MDAREVCVPLDADSSNVDFFSSEHLGLLGESLHDEEVEVTLPSVS